MKTKLLFVLPHCSTGGMPQFVLKQIETFKAEFDISVVEVNFYGGQYIVQRNAIRGLVPFYSLYGNQDNLPLAISKIDPDFVYFQEVPESFIKKSILATIYGDDRKYNIFVTTHSSLTKQEDFNFFPDKVIAVSDWQENKLADMFYGTKSAIDIWKYPIEPKAIIPEARKAAREKLGASAFVARMNGTYGIGTANMNILNVGLFTPGKNQGELFEQARKYPMNNYHFVGNQADNFEEYWGPLMVNKPHNVIIWGERNDTDLFYQAVDEFYFTSKFELMPLVLKEALSWGLPVKAHKLETYGTEFDNYNITWI
jgi:hypothetical protein